MTTQASQHASTSGILFWSVWGDVVFSSACGLAFTLAAGPLSQAVGLPVAAGFGLGLMLLGYAASLIWQGRRDLAAAARSAATLNLLWVAATAVLLVVNWIPFTPVGWWGAVIVGDAVLAFALFQLVGLRRSRQASA